MSENISTVISNFDFLKTQYPRLAELGRSSELYSHTDQDAALTKLRSFCELLVGQIYQTLNIVGGEHDDLNSRLNNDEFKNIVDKRICTKLHVIRQHGNKAAHENLSKKPVTSIHVVWLIKETYLVGRWFLQTINNSPVDTPDFIEPKKPLNIEKAQAEERERLLAELDNQKNEYVDEKNRLISESEASSKTAQNKADALNLANLELEKLRQALETQQDEIRSKEAKFDQEQQSAEFKNASSHSADSFDLAMENTRRNVDIFNYYEAVTLTDDQSDVVSKLKNFLTDNNQNVFILNGYAGTGKTFITKGFTRYLDAIGRDYTLMAPTGKAAKVLSDKTGRQAGTIHRVIYSYDDLKEFDDNGIESSETFRLYAQIKANLDTAEMVYIIDESSMVSDKYSDGEFFRFGSGYLLKDIFKHINIDHNDHNKKIIFIGDNAQLPPVGMDFSPALDAVYLKKTYQVKTISSQLTEVVRQKGESGVLKNASVIRQNLEANVFNQLVFDTSSHDVEKLRHSELLNRFITVCDNRVAKTGESVIIASSNRKVGEFNRIVREHFFPNKPEVLAGDKIISVANHYNDAGVITNGEFGMIKEVISPVSEEREVFLRKKGEGGEIETIKVMLSFRDVVIAFRNQSGEPFWFETKIIDNLLYNHEPGLTSDEQKAIYVDFRNRHPELLKKEKRQEFKIALQNDPYFNAFKVKFGYAITCHKAQGSEWENVFLECNSHLKVLTKDYFRWLYTAITRTSSKLYVVNPPNLGIGADMKVVGEFFLEDTDNQAKELIPATGSKPSTKALLNNGGAEFQFNSNNGHLTHLFYLVTQALIGSGIDVVNVLHNSYQERYIFGRDTENASINFIYKGNYRVSTISSLSLNDFDSELTALLSHIKGQILSCGSAVRNKEAVFAKDFLAQFHEKVISVIADSEIEIERIEQPDWAMRYSFIRGNETAVVTFWYDGKDRFTKVQPMPKLGNSHALLRDFTGLWTQA
jgi:tRNA A37 threonylcarbamoyladenosine biosynthesis protein TsaE